jgi:hypothetical protein
MQYLYLVGIILLAGIVSGGLGILWYSKVLFGNQWMRAMGDRAPKVMDKKRMAVSMLYGLIFDMITAFALLYLAGVFGIPLILLVATAWIAFIIPTEFSSTMYEKRSWTLFSLTIGYRLVSLLGITATFLLL